MMKIITGYTGTRHITPAMDAEIWRTIFNYSRDGVYSGQFYVLNSGGKFQATVQSANEILVRSGLATMQGFIVSGYDTTLTIDSCPSGYSRVDLIVCQYHHDADTGIDTVDLDVLKGTQVQNPNTPPVPLPETGSIAGGAEWVEMPLYEVHINGSTVDLKSRRWFLPTVTDGWTIRLEVGPFSSLPYHYVSDAITAKHIVVDSYLTNPSAQTAEWTVTTEDGELTVNGPINGTTNLFLTLTKGRYLYTRDM